MTSQKKVTPEDLEEIKKKILATAKKKGEIDQKDIFDQIPDNENNVDILDEIYGALVDGGIKILSTDKDDDEDTAKPDDRYLDDISDDSVRLYLREIGKIPLLNA